MCQLCLQSFQILGCLLSLLSTVIIEPSSSSLIINTIIQGPTPTATPLIPETTTTCCVLEDVVNIFQCGADATEPCDTIYCSEEIGGKNYSAVITLLPCEVPAAIRLELSSTDQLLLNKTINHSEENSRVPGVFGFSMNVTIDHFDNALGLQVYTYLGLQ